MCVAQADTKLRGSAVVNAMSLMPRMVCGSFLGFCLVLLCVTRTVCSLHWLSVSLRFGFLFRVWHLSR